MALTSYCCTNCGFWQAHFAPPPRCPVCEDHRHVLPEAGYVFLSPDEADAHGEVVWDEPEPGVWRFQMREPVGIGPMGYVVEHPEGNVAFEGCGWYSDAALEHVASLGGIRVATASHPHSYGALWRLVERFAPRVPLPVADLQWGVGLRVDEPYDDALALADGLALHRTGGHFPGHAVLHDARRGILFSGDALKLDLDPQDERRALGISCHKAFVRNVPLTRAELAGYRRVFERIAPWEQTWTPFEQGANAGRAAALALVDGQLANRPHADFVPVREGGRP